MCGRGAYVGGMTTNPTTTKTTNCPLCGEPKDANDTRPCAMGRSEVAPALRSQPHWLAPLVAWPYELGAGIVGGALFMYSNGQLCGGGGPVVIEAMLRDNGYSAADARNLVTMAMQAPTGQRVAFTVYR
jgi:hypothetical protein